MADSKFFPPSHGTGHGDPHPLWDKGSPSRGPGQRWVRNPTEPPYTSLVPWGADLQGWDLAPGPGFQSGWPTESLAVAGDREVEGSVPRSFPAVAQSLHLRGQCHGVARLQPKHHPVW